MGIACGKQKVRQTNLDNLKFDRLYQQKAIETPLRVRSRRALRGSAELSVATISSHEDIEKIYEIDPDIIGNIPKVSSVLNLLITRSRPFW